MEDKALRVGLGCGEEGERGSTLVLYLRGAGATEAWGAAAASTKPTARLPWVAAVVAVGARMVATAVAAAGAGTATTAVVATVVVVAGGPGLEPSAGEGEDCLTLGRKLCPPRVFTMDGLENKRRWRGWDEEGFHK